MSTPSTITATHPSHNFYPHYPDYNTSSTEYRSTNSNLPLSPYEPVPETRHEQPHVKTSMPPPGKRHDRKADWTQFYKNGIPKEVIVIDDSPERDTKGGAEVERHVDKRRKIDDTSKQRNHAVVDRTRSSSSRGRTDSNSTFYQSTAATSLGSTSSGSYKVDASVQAGQKRKRAVRKPSNPPDVGVLESKAQNDAWAYVPPPRPPIKAQEVYVAIKPDRTATAGQKIDDDDGHYIVISDTALTERYTIRKLLGQGTFGKVVQAYDRNTRTNCAIKIIRAVPKYRDASRIELRVLATLASNDKHNRNKCIHLRDCFDFRNHICIVTDLLSCSVFDFLKINQFTPFPSTHIQSFARQLFTSVAFLHDLNLIHTDLKPENILLVNNKYQTFTYERNIPSSSRSICRNAKQRRVLLNPEIRLIDFGSATFEDEYHSSVVSTRHYRAPEIILNLGWSFPCDIWSIGCILVEFYTGDALFQTHDNLEHLAMMEPVCNAKIEKELIDKVRQGRGSNRNSAASYFRPKAASLDYPKTDTPRTSRKYVKNMKKLDETILPTTPFNRNFLDLLRKIFVYDPKKRITAKDALKHPWFKDTLQDDGTEAVKIRKETEKRDAAQAAQLAHR